MIPGLLVALFVAALLPVAVLALTFLTGGGGYGLETNTLIGVPAGIALGVALASLGYWASAKAVWQSSRFVSVQPS